MLDHQLILRNYQQVLARIRQAADSCQRDPDQIRLIAVSKTHAVEAIKVLLDAGHRDFGESYAQELAAKAAELPAEVRWHFVGRIQTNKLNKIVPYAHCIHAVDSFEHAQAIAQALSKAGRAGRFPIYLSVNIGDEPQKSGLAPAAIPVITKQIQADLPVLEVLGVMAIPPADLNDQNYPSILPPAYVRLQQLAHSTGKGELSLGMTNDLRLAIAAGSTALRIGSAIFGDRQ